jgi:hypothetical protein
VALAPELHLSGEESWKNCSPMVAHRAYESGICILSRRNLLKGGKTVEALEPSWKAKQSKAKQSQFNKANKVNKHEILKTIERKPKEPKPKPRQERNNSCAIC